MFVVDTLRSELMCWALGTPMLTFCETKAYFEEEKLVGASTLLEYLASMDGVMDIYVGVFYPGS